MLNNPKISVCIPVYNTEKYISQCVESVILQDYKNIEIIISDNCSTDGTVEIIKSYLYDKRIKCYQNEANLGMHRNTKITMNYSTGDYIAFLSSDDYWNDKTYLSQAAEKLSAFDDAVMFCGGKKVLHEKIKAFQDLSDDTDNIFDGKEIFLNGLDAWPLFEIGAMVIKANLLKSAMSDIEYHCHADDVYIFWRLCLMGRLYIMRKPFLVYRAHDDNACRWKSFDDFIERILSNAIVPIKAYEIAYKKNMFPKRVLDKWLVKNVLLFILASYFWEWGKFEMLKSAYEEILAVKEISIADFGIEALFNRLREIAILENRIYYPSQNDILEDVVNSEDLDGGYYSFIRQYINNKYRLEYQDLIYILNEDIALKKALSDLLKNDFEQIGRLKYDVNIKGSLIKSGIDKNSIWDFFDVFIYLKIHCFIPAELQSLNFSAGGIGAFEEINGGISKIFNINNKNIDIYGRGWIIGNIQKPFFDKVYVVLSRDGRLEYFIETIPQQRKDISDILKLNQSGNCGYYFIIHGDTVLPGSYDILTIFTKENRAFIFDNNKKIILF